MSRVLEYPSPLSSVSYHSLVSGCLIPGCRHEGKKKKRFTSSFPPRYGCSIGIVIVDSVVQRLERKHRGKPSHRKEGETDHRRRKHSPRRRRNYGTPVGRSGRIALRREQCDVTPKSRNSGAREVFHCYATTW
jgi:hypothetical protein